MPSLPKLSGKDAVKAFCKAGYTEDRISGRNHAILKRAGVEIMLSVPLHDTLRAGTLRSLIRDAGMTVDEFREFM